MKVTLRQARPQDAEICGKVCYEAFRSIGDQHNFLHDFPNTEAGVGLLTMMLGNPGFYGVVAEADGKIAGSNFLDERGSIPGIGPISVSPSLQNLSIGRQLMQHLLDRVADRRYPGVRLVQAGYHNRSLCLYTKLGFDTREPLSIMQGAALNVHIPGHTVRAATDKDIGSCNRLCSHVHGHDRGGELRDAIKEGRASVVERDGRIAGYSTGVAFFAHSIAEDNEALKALIGAARAFPGPGFLLPTRNSEMFRWCLGEGLRLVYQMTLMTIGLYNEPQGAWLPSVLF